MTQAQRTYKAAAQKALEAHAGFKGETHEGGRITPAYRTFSREVSATFVADNGKLAMESYQGYNKNQDSDTSIILTTHRMFDFDATHITFNDLKVAIAQYIEEKEV